MKTPLSFILVFAIVFLSGCSVGDSNSCTTPNNFNTSTKVDSWGLTLLPSDNMYVSFEKISIIYQETMQCVGLTALGPVIKFFPFGELTPYKVTVGGSGGWGVYTTTGEVWINTNLIKEFTRDCRTDEEALRHEFIHHILTANSMGAQSSTHASSYFSCQPGVNTYN